MSEERKDGGPAFPFPAHYDAQGCPVHDSPAGMSLRDYFAASVAAQCASAVDNPFKPEDVAYRAYDLADALLRAREGDR